MGILANVLRGLLQGSGPARTPARRGDGVTVVTSMHPAGWEEYGRRCLDGFERHWPSQYRLRFYAEDFVPQGVSPRVEVVDLLSAVPDVAAFRERCDSPQARGRMADGGYNYRYDAVKFANKALALVHASRTCGTRYLVWLDADTVTLRDVPPDLVQTLLADGCFVAYLGRAFSHSETGFLAFDLANPSAEEFFSAYRGLYMSGELLRLREWHDCEVFDVTRTVFAAQGRIRTRDLSPPGTTHPFPNSVLGEYMDHLKGPDRKKAGASSAQDYRYFRGRRLPPVPPNLEAGRYAYVPALVEAVRPRSIVEIGTWSGHRALQMARVALRHSAEVTYHGYDLFEAASAEDDAREMNVKPHYPLEDVRALLEKFALENPGFRFTLTQGDTRTSLPPTSADLAFIDGGHSIETIRSDFDRLRGSRVVLLDDWYDGPIDVERFGCNAAIRDLPHLVLPQGDPVAGGGHTRFAVVASEADLALIRRAVLRSER
jgi:hypothetical protein